MGGNRVASASSVPLRSETPSRGVAAYWDSAHDTSNVWVSIRDMRQRLITGSAERISDLGVKKSNVKLQQPGTVLLSFKLSIGRVAIAAVPLFTNEAIAGLSPTGLTRDFLFHGLQGWDLLQGADQAIKGATLNKQKLKKVLFEYPESEREQAKIAEVLSTVDRAIEETEALIAKQQRINTGLMQDLLTRGIDEHGNLRSGQTHKFKDSPLGRIPVEWDIASLGSVAEFVTSGSRGWAKYYREEGALFIRIGNLTREHINLRLDDLVFVQPPESAEGLRTAVQAGDPLDFCDSRFRHHWGHSEGFRRGVCEPTHCSGSTSPCRCVGTICWLVPFEPGGKGSV